jgi:hypothetical protein
MRHYLVPRVGDGKSRETGFRPAYIPSGHDMTCMDFGEVGLFFVSVELDEKEHNKLISNKDVFEIKDSAAVSEYMNSINLPTTDSTKIDDLINDIKNIAMCEQRSLSLYRKRTSELSNSETDNLVENLGLSGNKIKTLLRKRGK